MSELTTPVLIQLSDEEREALREFVRKDGRGLTEGAAARILLRDALIGIGDLKLERER